MKVTIVTPSFNQGKFIERTLRSVAVQTGVSVEHVVRDGGSTDQTVDILKRSLPAENWSSKKDGGQADAVNKGISATGGEIIGWLNSDDIYYPDAIAEIVAQFESRPEVDVIYGMADHIDENDRAFESYPSEPWNFERLKETCFICQPAAFFRRKVVEQFGLLDEELHFCMDYEFWLRLGKAGVQFHYLERKLAGSRMYAGNKTLGSRVKVHAEINEMFKHLFGRVPDRWIWNYAHAIVEDRVDPARHPRRFAFELLFAAVAAAWRWNRKLSPSMKPHMRSLWRRCWA
jgi:glycosyltransferase involved in cell wall biosynthesis